MVKDRLKVGGQMIGDPDEIAQSIQLYGPTSVVDSLVFAPLVTTMNQKNVLRSVEAFGKHVLPRVRQGPGALDDSRARSGAEESRLTRAEASMDRVFDKVLIGGKWLPAAVAPTTS